MVHLSRIVLIIDIFDDQQSNKIPCHHDSAALQIKENFIGTLFLILNLASSQLVQLFFTQQITFLLTTHNLEFLNHTKSRF
jgi:hypothetical protein